MVEVQKRACWGSAGRGIIVSQKWTPRRKSLMNILRPILGSFPKYPIPGSDCRRVNVPSGGQRFRCSQTHKRLDSSMDLGDK